MFPHLTYGDRTLSLEQPVIMGILNVTPDSFSDGGRYQGTSQAIDTALAMQEQGASIIDVGGESTRPGAQAVSVVEELHRTVGIVAALSEAGLLVSVDTSKPEVMQGCVEAGAFMINDVRALREKGALPMVAELGAPVCLMHMQGQPRSMQKNPRYTDVVRDVMDFLSGRVDACVSAGISRNKLVIDPGFGFGKNTGHNLELLRRLADLGELGVPVLAGLSRKSLFGQILGLDVDNRLHASVAAGLMAVERGARIVRVHDVQATAHALGVFKAVMAIGVSNNG